MKNNFSKILIVFLVMAILTSGFVFPKETKAVLGVGDVVVDPTVNASIWAHIGKDIVQWIKEAAWPVLRDRVAKRLIDYVVDQTVNWIQGGGKPKFVGNWSGFLKKAGDIAFDEIIRDVRLARLISLAAIPKFSQRITCTLDEVVENIEDFYNDFSKGGWIAYNEAWQPQNNYYGISLMIADETLLRTDTQTEAAKSEATASGGFLSPKKCKGESFTTAEYNQLDDQRYLVQDSFGNWCFANALEIQTPGSLAGQALASAITADTQWAANIQSWTSALINAAINRLITKGVNEMQSSSGNGEYNSSYSPDYYPSEYRNLSQEMMQYDKEDKISQLNNIIDPLKCTYGVKSDTLVLVTQLVSDLNQIKGLGCPVSESEIRSALKNLKNISSEVNKLKSEIEDGNTIIAELNSATTSEELASAELDYSNFINTYSDSYVSVGTEFVTNKYSSYAPGSSGEGGFCASKITQNSSETDIDTVISRLAETAKNEEESVQKALLNAIAVLNKVNDIANNENLSCQQKAISSYMPIISLEAILQTQAEMWENLHHPNRAGTLCNARADIVSVLNNILKNSTDLMTAVKENKEISDKLNDAEKRLKACATTRR
jgi:hypothetical protein